MHEPRIDIVCFDLGGVIVKICRTFEEACTVAGVPVRGDPALVPVATFELDRQHALGLLSAETWAEESARALGERYSPAEILRVYHAWMLGEYAGLDSVLGRIEERGVTTACLSNTTEGHWRRLVHRDGEAPLAGPPEFPAIVRLQRHYASHRLGLLKPEEAIYRAFEQQVGHRGRSILFFDDLPENVESARRVGWRAELVDHRTETAPQLLSWLEQHGVL